MRSNASYSLLAGCLLVAAITIGSHVRAGIVFRRTAAPAETARAGSLQLAASTAPSDRAAPAPGKAAPVPASKKPGPRLRRDLTRMEAARLASQRGCRFYWPSYWPKGLPKPHISGYLEPLPPEFPTRGIFLSSEGVIPPKERFPPVKGGVKGIDLTRRSLSVSFWNRSRVPSRYRLKLSPPERPRTPSRFEGPRLPDRFHGRREKDRTLAFRIRGRQALIHRVGGVPTVWIAWTEGNTWVYVESAFVPEDQLRRMIESLRPVAVPGQKQSRVRRKGSR